MWRSADNISPAVLVCRFQLSSCKLGYSKYSKNKK